MKRSGPLRRGKWSGKAATARRQARSRAKFRRQFHSDAFVDFIHSLGCVVPLCTSEQIEAAHVEKRSRGQRVTWEAVVPLCVWHHHEQEGRNAEFEARYGLDLESIAAATALRWKAWIA